MLGNSWFKKEKPLFGLIGLGGGVGSNLVAGAVEVDPSFKVLTYTGTGLSKALECGFQPDLVWIKDLTQAHNHNLMDVARGASGGGYHILCSDDTNGDITNSTDGFKTIDTNGFTLGTNTLGTQSYELNKNGNDYVAWCWLAGGSPTSNPNGSITSSVSANTASGFSIVKWTDQNGAQTIGHGLNSAPELILLKDTGATSSWSVYSSHLANTEYLFLNTSDDAFTGSGRWNSTNPTSSVFSWSDNTTTNVYVAYCFHSVTGVSKIGTYTGTGTDVTVTTGFEPAMVFLKQTTGGNDWYIFDSERSVYVNPSNDAAQPGSDFSNHALQSNGFYFNTSNAAVNGNGDEYIYAAFK